MGTEILRPQDCLMRVPSSTASITIPRSGKPSSNSYYYSSNPNPKFYRKTEQRKQPQQQHHRYFSQSETSVVKNGVRSSSSSPKLTPSTSPATTTGKSVVKNELTASVTILKRGESLDNINSKKKTEKLKIKRSVSGDLSSGFSSSSSSSSGSESSSDSERGVVRSEVYAGNAFYLSPAPSSLPLPTFFSIKKEGGCGASAIIDDSATKDLRRLLRLD